MADEEKLKLGKGAAFVKSRLKRLPQGDETWEADFRALPKPIDQSDTHYRGMAVAEAGGSLLSESEVHGRPSVNDLATLLAHAMRRPLDGNARRPRLVRLRGHHHGGVSFPTWRTSVSGSRSSSGRASQASRRPTRSTSGGCGTSRGPGWSSRRPSRRRSRHVPGHRPVGRGVWLDRDRRQELFGFVARASHEGGTQVEDERADTLAEAMAALERAGKVVPRAGR